MKLSNLFLSISAVFLLISCGEAEGSSTSSSTSYQTGFNPTTSTTSEPQIVEFDLPDYKFVAANSEATLNRVFSYDKTTKELSVDYYDSVYKLKTGVRNATKSFKQVVTYVSSGNTHCDNNTFANVVNGNSTYSFFFNNGYLNGIVTTVDGSSKRGYSLVVSKYEDSQLYTLLDVLGKTFITTSSISYYDDDNHTIKHNYYLKFEFTNTSFDVYYRETSEWAIAKLAYEVPLTRFNGAFISHPDSGYTLERIRTEGEDKFLEVDKVFKTMDYAGEFTATNLRLEIL